MIAKLQNLTFQEGETTEEKIHSLPCKIHFNGKAYIQEFFNPTSAHDAEGEYIASLRGYHLNGQLITLPDTYHGFVLKADTPGSLSPEHKFQSLTYWEWDKKPTKNDPFLAALDWLLLSSQVHDPIEDDE